MRGWGVLFIILGIGSFILPMFHMQFRLVSIFGDGPGPGIGFIVMGGVLLLISAKQA